MKQRLIGGSLRGIAIWSLGQEDMRLWEALPKQI